MDGYIKSVNGEFYVMDPCYVNEDTGMPYQNQYLLYTRWGSGKYPYCVVYDKFGELVGLRIGKTPANLEDIAIFTVADSPNMGVDSGLIAFMDASIFPLLNWKDDNDPNGFIGTFLEAPQYGTALDDRVVYCSPGDGCYRLFKNSEGTLFEICFDYDHNVDDEDEEAMYELGLDMVQGV